MDRPCYTGGGGGGGGGGGASNANRLGAVTQVTTSWVCDVTLTCGAEYALQACLLLTLKVYFLPDQYPCHLLIN